MADSGLVIAHSQKSDTNAGLNLLTVDPSLEKSCHMADSSLVVANSQGSDTNAGLNHLTVDPSLEKSCHMADSGLVVAHTQGNDTNTGLNLSHNNLSVTDTLHTVTICAKEDIVEKAKKQIGTAFGCLPLSTIKLFTGEPTYYDKIPDIIQTHRLVRQSGVPNFLGLRIPIPTQLKVDPWRYYLRDYFDQQLPDLIKFGFPLDFDRAGTLGQTLDNHASANEYPYQVHKYIQEEISHNAMLGPFGIPPFNLHISPFMTRDLS